MEIKELDTAFEKVISHLATSIYYAPYSEDSKEFERMLEIAINQKTIYDLSLDFTNLDLIKLEDIHLSSLPLLEKYALEECNYAEQIEIWSDALLNTIKKIKGEKEKNNGVKK